ncbi:MAG TPA: single-stranded DNA-binding protein [Kiritimatiellia bacterium]|nr:single-stranded DNA-binding protein [Kiritimatiellia bacterium]HNR94486.1 single-stranded DNA-binding protein [Kiritimatiellia bacterium]HNS81056.1 single-stranded DNA-binding protein [Kiritimatiellia bacterium]HPA78387.1 single-stranded DNA-binding protein [Kiritimatiellia bacterium]HQQ04411.1 single-stranded DNA-binding protein [Kiritimatiellia bacterium]
MASFNKVILVGNLTKDPEVRYTSSGTTVGNMRLAVTEHYKKQTGEMQETTCFVDVEVWGRQAETCSEYLKKGSSLLLEGKLKLDEWETSEGEKRSKLRVRADRVQFLGSPRGDRSSGGSKPASSDESAMPADGGDDDNLPF